MDTMSKTAQVIKFYVQEKPLARIMLAKLAYMADLNAHKYLGRPISELQYVYDVFGPYDSEGFYPAIQDLKDRSLIQEQAVPSHFGDMLNIIEDEPRQTTFSFSPAEKRILSWNLREYGDQELLKFLHNVVYNTPPLEKGTRGNPLEMYVVEDDEKDYLHIDFDTVLQSEAEIANGEYETADVFFDQLQCHYSPDRPLSD